MAKYYDKVSDDGVDVMEFIIGMDMEKEKNHFDL